MAIPENAANKAAALVTANEIMKPYMQVKQFNNIGYYPFTPYELMDEEGREAYDAIQWTDGLIEPSKMQDYYVPNVHGQNNDLVEQIWAEEVNGKQQ
jgi:spermidine/putrescine-binding protein